MSLRTWSFTRLWAVTAISWLAAVAAGALADYFDAFGVGSVPWSEPLITSIIGVMSAHAKPEEYSSVAPDGAVFSPRPQGGRT
jgi:hypothetical protein